MATSIGQYTSIFCLESSPCWQRSLAGHSLQGCKESGHNWSDPVRTDTRLFFTCGSSAQWELCVKVAQLLGLQGPWWRQVCRDTDCLCCRSYGPIRGFFWAACSWWSEGLSGQSFSIAPPIQALRGMPCLRSFSVPCVRHMEEPPWLGSYCIDQCSASGIWRGPTL